jgi:hypothetical protein
MEREPFSAPEQPDTWPEPELTTPVQLSSASAEVSVSASFSPGYESLSGISTLQSFKIT